MHCRRLIDEKGRLNVLDSQQQQCNWTIYLYKRGAFKEFRGFQAMVVDIDKINASFVILVVIDCVLQLAARVFMLGEA